MFLKIKDYKYLKHCLLGRLSIIRGFKFLSRVLELNPASSEESLLRASHEGIWGSADIATVIFNPR